MPSEVARQLGTMPVRERVGGEVLDVLRQRVVAAAQRRAGAGGGGERQGAARRDGVLDEPVERRAGGLAGGDDEADDEVLERRREVDAGRSPPARRGSRRRRGAVRRRRADSRPSASTRSRMARSAAAPGSVSATWSRKRSSWASGSGKVPSCSIEFCVATTMNGSGSGRVTPPAVIWRSAIASSRADCTLGGARLISSTRTSEWKSGPGTKSKRASSGRKTWVPVMSEGIRSGVHWMRAKLGVEAGGQRLDGAGLGEAGRALDQAGGRRRARRSPAARPAARGRRGAPRWRR